MVDNIENEVAQIAAQSVEWSMSVRSSQNLQDEESSDDEDDENDVFGTSFL